MKDGSKSLKKVRNVAVSEGAIVLHKWLAECHPHIVSHHLRLLMSTMTWSIRARDPVTAINELYLKITACKSQSGERMTDTVTRGVLLTRLTLLPEVQKHVKNSARKTEFSCENENRSGESSSCGSLAP